jgi:hypothetical protein
MQQLITWWCNLIGITDPVAIAVALSIVAGVTALLAASCRLALNPWRKGAGRSRHMLGAEEKASAEGCTRPRLGNCRRAVWKSYFRGACEIGCSATA